MDRSKAEILRNVILATPLTSKGKDALLKLGKRIDEINFLENCYIQPFTDFERTEDDFDEFDDPDNDTLDYRKEKNHNSLIASKSEFESSFCGTKNKYGDTQLVGLVDSLFIIKGVAGSGKTTYLHHLLYENKNYISQICDLEKSEKSFYFINDAFDLGDVYRKSTSWKFNSIILPQISEILTINELPLSEHKEKIKSIYTIYKQYFENYSNHDKVVDNQEFKEFFTILNKYSESILNYNKFGETIKDLIKQYFFKDSGDSIQFITGVLIRLYYCLSKLPQYENYKFICAIDNIERYINNTPIQDSELQKILSSIEAMMEDFTNKILRIIQSSNEKYSSSFGLIIVMRDTTANIGGLKHFNDGDHQIKTIDISDWYSILDVYERKIKYFDDICESIKSESFFIAFHNIINDNSKYKWGLKNLTTQMYNYNHRSIATNILTAISTYPRLIELFNKLWEEAIVFKSSCLKHLCRKLILRILFDHIQEKDYLNKLTPPSETDSEDYAYNSFARRVSTYLSRISNNGNNKKYISFPQIIKKILCKPNFSENEITEMQLQQFSSILYLMDQSFISDNNWAPLIVIKFDDPTVFSEHNLYLKMLEQWRNYIQHKNRAIFDDISHFAIKITDAGKFYAKITPDFEHFAARYTPDMPPLVAVNSFETCKQLINEIRKKAFLCVDRVIEVETKFFCSMGPGSVPYNNFYGLYSNEGWLYKGNSSNRGHVHPYRILTNHIEYLLHYREYINIHTFEEDFQQKEDRQKILYLVSKTIDEYNKKRADIEKKNPAYFNLKS